MVIRELFFEGNILLKSIRNQIVIFGLYGIKNRNLVKRGGIYRSNDIKKIYVRLL